MERHLMMLIKIVLFGMIAPLLWAQNPTSKSDRDLWVDSLVSAMTLEEKIDFIGGYQEFFIRPYPQHGIPMIRISDGPVGVRNFGPATAYPASIALAAAFNRDLANQYGAALGLEARSKNAHILLGPGMNIYRMSIGGRNFEYLGEDPYLAGQMAKQCILGIQQQGVIATAKHYLANNNERNRHHCSSNIDVRTLREIYLPAFEVCVKEAKVAAVMTSYNLINGVQASEHHYFNNELLKGEWGFEGFIVSDWASTYNALPVIKGGLDLEMPKGAMMNRDTIIPAIQNGSITEAAIDGKVRRILRVYARFGYFSQPDLSANFILDSAFVRNTAVEIARQGMVLLKNEAHTLPLNKERIKTIAVVGPYGTEINSGARGSSYTQPRYPLSFVEALKQVAPNIHFTAESGVFMGVPFPDGIFDTFHFYTKKDGKNIPGAFAEYYGNKNLEGEIIHSKYIDKINLVDEDFWGDQTLPNRNFSARYTCYYTPQESGYYSMAGCGDDGYRIFVDGIEVVGMWQEQGPTNAKHDMFLNGSQEYKITVEFFQSGGGALIKLGVKKIDLDLQPESYITKATELAKKAEWVILPVGFSSVTEGEAADRSFEMPYKQANLIQEVARANPNVIVVVTAGGGFETASWINRVKGVLLGWYPGQEGTLAAAEILFGKTNPSGKLPITIETRLEENPWYPYYQNSLKDDTKMEYGEGIFVGYRHWDKANVKPAFPFGFGLSYTTFSYSNIKTDKKIYPAGETVSVTVTVKNTGKRAGSEAVQLYVSDLKSVLPRPVKELKDFAKVHLNSGEKKTMTFYLDNKAFMYYNPEKMDWVLEPGEFEILIGGSSVDIRQRVKVTMN
jgi:beta-glucosidase